MKSIKEYKIKENKTAEFWENIFIGIFSSSLVLCLILCISCFGIEIIQYMG